MTTIILTSGERVAATNIDETHYLLPGGRIVRTWTDEDGQVYQDSESADE